MKYRPFGRTGWEVSEISFGGWQIGGQWGEVDDAESIRTLLYAYENGINLVDTAEYYGAGHSETVIGESLRQWKGGRVFVATKVQPLQWPSSKDDNPLMRGRYPEWYLRESVDKSLSRLGVEQLDLLQLHCWVPDGIGNLDWLETLNELRVEGKIDQIGVSIRDYRPNEGVDLAHLGLVASQQVIFNLFEQRPVQHLFPAAGSTETAILARVPFDSGALTGGWDRSTYSTWEPGSVQHELFRDGRFDETMDRIDALKALVAPFYETLAEAAMRYSLSSHEVSSVIFGVRNPNNIDRNIAYADGEPFPAELLLKLRDHAWPRNYYA